MNAPDDALAIGVDAALGNCADYLREEIGLVDAAAQVEAARHAVAQFAAANWALLAAEPERMAYRNAAEREAYQSIRAALARIGGTA